MSEGAIFRPEGDDGPEVEMQASKQCYFCGRTPSEGDRPIIAYLALVDEYQDENLAYTIGWACHRECVIEARHPNVPAWPPAPAVDS